MKLKLFDETSGSYERIAKMYPSFYRKIYEMQEILKAQGILADELMTSIERVFCNQFIDCADENVISGFEKKLGIEPDKAAALEERRRIVKACLIGGGKVSISIIKEMISAYTNADVRCDFSSIDGKKNRILNFVIERGTNSFFSLKEICSILDTKLPAHISYNWRVDIRSGIEFVYDYKLSSTSLPKCGEFNCGEEIVLCF